MKMKNTAIALATGSLLTFGVASTAAAQDVYLGGGITHWNYSQDNLDDFKDIGASLRVGTNFNEYLGLEGHLTTGGDDSQSVYTPYGSANVKVELDMIASVFLKGKIPFNNQFRGYVLGGMSYLDATAKANSGYSYASESADDTNLAGGIGAEFDVTNNFTIGGDFIRHSFGESDYDADTASLVGTYHF